VLLAEPPDAVVELGWQPPTARPVATTQIAVAVDTRNRMETSTEMTEHRHACLTSDTPGDRADRLPVERDPECYRAVEQSSLKRPAGRDRRDRYRAVSYKNIAMDDDTTAITFTPHQADTA
jgi:hypothetical protein